LNELKKMKVNIEGKYTVSIIGLLFTAIVFISTFTIVIPLLTLILPGLLELIASSIVGDSEYKTIGISVLTCLVIIFIITTYASFKLIFRKKELLKKELIYYFTFQVFIIPSIFFYAETFHDGNWERASDGQFFLGIFEVFPFSSISFIIIGVFIDIIRNRKSKTDEKI
jgi:hypothetical protein